MDSSLYEEFASIEATHWWFQGRRRIVADALRRRLRQPSPPADPHGRRILDIGCGTGEMLDMLTEFGTNVIGVDGSADAVTCCERRLGSRASVVVGRIPEDLPEGTYDIVTAFDVLEHLDDDAQALAQIYRRLPAGGILVCTVPAYMALWSPHDERSHHRRRYTRRGLEHVIASVGFDVERSSYFNTWLLPVVALVRVAKRRGVPLPQSALAESDFAMPNPFANRLLTTLFASERLIMRAVSLPAGVSILAISRKPGSR